MMGNRDAHDDLGDAKKYLEEVMGIVEDEEFNRKRREKRKMARVKELELEEYDEPSDEVWCCTKIVFFLILIVFLTCSVIVITNYKEDDSLGLRRIIQEDPLGVSRLGVILDTDRISHGLKIRDLYKIPSMMLTGVSYIASELKPVLTKLWFFIEQKWLTPTMRVYKDNFPFLKEGEKRKDFPPREAENSKQKRENRPESSKERKEREATLESHKENAGEEKIKDFKKLQDNRRIKDNIAKDRNTEKHKEELKPKEKQLKDDFGAFVHKDL